MDDLIELLSIMSWYFFIAIIVLCVIIKKVPSNSLIIIDRNSHFHKKKRHGFYILGAHDKVTTYLSTNAVTQTYANIFETHISTFYRLSFSVTYRSEDLDRSQQALEDSRRSVYDIINCAAETVIGTIASAGVVNLQSLNDALFRQLESTLEPFYIDVTSSKIFSILAVDSTVGRQNKFQKHISTSGGDNPFI